MGWRGEGLGAPLDSRAQDPKAMAQHREDGRCPLSPVNIRAFNGTSSSGKPGPVSPDRRHGSRPGPPFLPSPFVESTWGPSVFGITPHPTVHTHTHTHTRHSKMRLQPKGPPEAFGLDGELWIMPQAAIPPTLPSDPHTETPASPRAAIPNLLGTRDQFRGRQFFHGPGQGWFPDNASAFRSLTPPQSELGLQREWWGASKHR